MRVREAARAVNAGELDPTVLWRICTPPERVQIALLLDRPEDLPPGMHTPALAWGSLNNQQRRVILADAPPRIRRALPRRPEDA